MECHEPCNQLLNAGGSRCTLPQLWRVITEDSPIAVCLVSVDGQWLQPHKRIAEWLGYSIAEMERLTFQGITHSEDLAIDLANTELLLRGRAKYYQMEKRYLAKNGSVVWVRLTVTAILDGDRVACFLSQIENITDRKETEYELRRSLLREATLAVTDPLTALGNRRQFESELARNWRILLRKGTPFGLIMIDFNEFKAVNSRHGHPGGDAALKDAARKLEATVRAIDGCYRTGGDEFAVIMPDTDTVESAIDRLNKSLESSVEYQGQTIRYSCSVDGAVCDKTVQSLEELVRSADDRMMAKKSKR